MASYRRTIKPLASPESRGSQGSKKLVCFVLRIVVLPLLALVSIMSELAKKPVGPRHNEHLQAFWEYLDGYSMAFEMFPECYRQQPPAVDVYRVVQDYWSVTEDMARGIHKRANPLAKCKLQVVEDGSQAGSTVYTGSGRKTA
jgi:hypothetical protein